MNTRTINTTKPTQRAKAASNGKAKHKIKYTALELEAIRLGREIKKSLEAGKSDAV